LGTGRVKENRLWEYSGRGIVLLDEEGVVEVLTEKDDYGKNGMKMIFRQNGRRRIGIKAYLVSLFVLSG
jgi:hypothetical protein